MKETPILMCAEMVRATMKDRKTNTRRILRPQPVVFADHMEWRCKKAWYTTRNVHWNPIDNAFRDAIECGGCPHGQPGDRLWVKENWRVRGPHTDRYKPVDIAANCSHFEIAYEADIAWNKDTYGKLRPSIFLPRSLSRITIEITDVKVERVQDITERDALAEGVAIDKGNAYHVAGHDGVWAHATARGCFETLWDSLNKARGFGWETNPWVWCLTFRRL
jgi:hypothetical protein